MISRVVDTALVRRDGNAHWAVTLIEHPGGLAVLRRDGPLHRVIVADAPLARADSGCPDAYSAATWTPDGDLALVVRLSPPGLVLSPTSCGTAPGGGADRDCIRPAPGDRVLLLSCAAFDRVPEVLAQGVAHPPTLIEQDAEELLLEIFRDIGRGAGAVIDRRREVTVRAASA
jgi:hypothetical protein